MILFLQYYLNGKLNNVDFKTRTQK